MTKMSKTAITIERINQVDPHPNADRLDVVQVLGYSVVVSKGSFKVGDAGVYFPPDMLIPQNVAEDLGVANYLRHAVYPGDTDRSKCRISSCRLRGVPSYGFLINIGSVESFGADVTEMYKGKKYSPPTRVLGGDCLQPVPEFHEYTEIENIQRFPNAFTNELVRITEKIHGTNCRLGLIGGELMAGSHKTRRVEGDPRTMYWKPMDIVEPLLRACASRYGGNIIVFGEIFGPKIQDMDYGASVPMFRAFDISVNGRYLSDVNFSYMCADSGVETVPSLYCGMFNMDIVKDLTDGPTLMGNDKDIRCAFKGREGVVIKPLCEQFSDVLGGRLILKSVSVDYHQRKGAKDDG